MSTSFHEPADEGLRLLYSEDGIHWDSIPGTWLTPQIGDKIMRDPSIWKGPDNVYHMVWTIAWKGDSGFGYAWGANSLSKESATLGSGEFRPGRVSRNLVMFGDGAKEKDGQVTYTLSLQGKFVGTDTIHFRHPGKGANISWSDGHVSSERYLGSLKPEKEPLLIGHFADPDDTLFKYE